MHRIDHTTNIAQLPTPGPAGTPGYWTSGDPQTGVEATILDQDWFNAIQEELIYLVTRADITPAKSQFNQIYAALLAMFRRGGAGVTITAAPTDRADVELDATDIGMISLDYPSGADITITNITGGVKGQLLILHNGTQSTDCRITLEHNSSLRTAAGTDTVLWEQQIIMFVWDDINSVFREISPTSGLFRSVSISCFGADTSVATGNAAGFYVVGEDLNGWRLVSVIAAVAVIGGTSGQTEVHVRRLRSGSSYDVLDPPITIDYDELTATDGVLKNDNIRLEVGDILFIDVDALPSGGTPKGLVVNICVRAGFGTSGV